MNSQKHHTELLLMLNTGFFSNHLQKVNRIDTSDWYAKREQLIDACWEGLTPEMLPECFSKTGSSVNLREIIDGNSFLDLQFSEGRKKREKQYALNPYIFMQVQVMN